MEDDAELPDADGLASQQEQNYVKALSEQELDEKYPNRPINHSNTLPFHQLFTTLFNPLLDNRQKPGAITARRKQGPHGPTTLSPNEARRQIIERFIARWRKEVGNDIFPAFRLIIPDRDRERSMYGLKEKTIGKLLVKILGIDKHSPDADSLLNWKLSTQKSTSSTAGDFPGRCYEVLRKRALQTDFGTMTVAEVNEKLDDLSIGRKEADQLPILEDFYNRMNPEEMLWLIRMILRQMKIGSTEKTFFDIWHPDAETLFNISSNLRRVCWELYDPDTRLVGDNAEVSLMQCFQPQLAQFQMHNMEKMVLKMRPTEADAVFWIEEKLDGERMQLHMIEDETHPGGKRFGFWSRKAKDYTYLYGNGFYDDNSALTRHLKEAFTEGVKNIILDGEMITWDPASDKIVPFGTLKTAALSEQKNPFGTGERPLYRVFDILLLNDTDITRFTLRDRRAALNGAIKPVHRRLEIHGYDEAKAAKEVEDKLRQVIEETSEGLVLKNPRSMYRLNERNDDWMKVKPEYMTEYGEALDCLVVGGYYGSGHRGGNLSSFMCALRADPKPGVNPEKCYSFFKVGGGFTAQDYATIRHRTDGKWQVWDPKHPPTEFIELGGGDRQFERPDEWIRPSESFVISVKAASVARTELFQVMYTLRFPRFKAMRTDKDWKSALSVSEFHELKGNVEKEIEEKKLVIDDERRKKRQAGGRQKKPLTIAGAATEQIKFASDDYSTNVFAGLSFCIMSGSREHKKTKTELEALVKHHGGSVFQSPKAAKGIICIAETNEIKVASFIKTKEKSLFKPIWLLDCVNQAKRDLVMAGDEGYIPLVLPFENPRHIREAIEEDMDILDAGIAVITGQAGAHIAIDEWGDSFARDIASIDELRSISNAMPAKYDEKLEPGQFMEQLHERGNGFEDTVGWLFQGSVAWFDGGVNVKVKKEDEMDNDTDEVVSDDVQLGLLLASNTFRFASGSITHDLSNEHITHIVISSSKDTKERARELRKEMAK